MDFKRKKEDKEKVKKVHIISHKPKKKNQSWIFILLLITVVFGVFLNIETKEIKIVEVEPLEPEPNLVEAVLLLRYDEANCENEDIKVEWFILNNSEVVYLEHKTMNDGTIIHYIYLGEYDLDSVEKPRIVTTGCLTDIDFLIISTEEFSNLLKSYTEEEKGESVGDINPSNDTYPSGGGGSLALATDNHTVSSPPRNGVDTMLETLITIIEFGFEHFWSIVIFVMGLKIIIGMIDYKR